MKKQFLTKHKGVAMAIAVGAAAMTAPMTTHAAELGEAETPVEPVDTTPTEDPEDTTDPAPVNTEDTTDPAPVNTEDTTDPAPVNTEDTTDPAPTENTAATENTAPVNTAPTENTDPVNTTPMKNTAPVNTEGTAKPETPKPEESDTSSALEEAEGNLEQAKNEEEAAKAEKEKAEAEKQEAAKAEQEAQENVDNANQDVQDIRDELTDEKETAEGDVADAQQAVTNAETSEKSNQDMTNLTESQQQIDKTKNDLTEIIAGTITEDQSQSDEDREKEAAKQANDLIARQEAVKTAEEKAAEAEAALKDTASQEDSAKKKAEEAKTEMDKSESELKTLQDQLETLEQKVADAQSALETAIGNATAADGTTEEAQNALGALNDLLEQYTAAQDALNTALAAQTDVTKAQQTLRDAQTALDNLVKAQTDYAAKLQEWNEKKDALNNIQNANDEVSAAQTALQELVSDQTNIKIICDELQHLTQDKAENLNDLKEKLGEYADNFTNKKEEYQNAVNKIDNYLKAVHDLNVPTTELLDATWLTGDNDADADTAAAEKRKLLNVLSEALKGNLSDSAKADLNKAETALNTAKNKLLTAVESIVKATATLSDGNELAAPETTTDALSNALAALTAKAGAIDDDSSDNTEKTLKANLTSAATALSDASDALKAAAEKVTENTIGTTIDQSAIDAATDAAAKAIQAALKALVITQDDQTQGGIADANVAAKQEAVETAQNSLKTGIDSICDSTSTLSDTHKTAINGAYDELTKAQTKLNTDKPDLQSDIAKANETYLTKVAEYKAAYAQLTWLQKDLADAEDAKTTTESASEAALADRDTLLKQIVAPGSGLDTSLDNIQQGKFDALKNALEQYTNAQQKWVSARQNIETTRQSIKDAKENLSAKKTDLAKAIAKKTLAETIFAGNDVSSVEAEIKEMGFQLSDFDNDIPTYQTARKAVEDAETDLTTKKEAHAAAAATLEDAKEKYEQALANLAIAQGDYDALKPKPPVPSTPSTPLTPLASHVQSSRVNTPPSYEAAYEAVSVSADAGHEDDSAYTYSGFLKECEKSILTLKPMNRTSPNLQLTVNNSGLTIKTKTWMSFDRKVIEALSKRPDLALDLSFLYKGKWYRAIIPAGYDLTSLLNEEGYCGFLYLYSLFGVVWQTPAV